ncbi:MAG: hypothetical protein ACK4PH_01725 [Aquincola tertiaricarbonis]
MPDDPKTAGTPPAPPTNPPAADSKPPPAANPAQADATTLKGIPAWVVTVVKAGADLKVPGFSAACNGLLVLLTAASNSGFAPHAARVLRFCVLALAVPATAAALLLGIERVWPKGVDSYTSLIRAGFSIRKSADEAVTDDHGTLDYYQLLNVGLNTKTVDARRQYQVLLAPRQQAALAFNLGKPEYLSADGCPNAHTESATIIISLGQELLRELTYDGAPTPQVVLDSEWWDQNEPKLHARGFPRINGQYSLPLVVSLASNTAVQVSKDAVPCVTFSPLIAIEVYKKKFPKSGR